MECAEYVHKLMEWAEAWELKVILCLHTAPGSQNGHDHSGIAGAITWHQGEQNVAKTLEIITRIAQDFGGSTALAGIEVLNEPSSEILLSTLQDFYTKAYFEVRKHCEENVAVLFSDAYRPIAEWEDFINDSKFTNVLLDVHLYQVFSDKDISLSFEGHLDKALKWQKMIETFGAKKIIVGEWSAGLHGVFRAMDPEQALKAKKLYLHTQELAFSQAAGHFYWNYKTESNNTWNYRSLA